MRRAAASGPDVLILDTDPLMTAAWARMLFGEVPAELLAYEKAELYLLCANDVPWIDDGTRFFGSDAERARFAAIAEAVLVETNVPYVHIAGDWTMREAQVRAALTGLLAQMQPC